MGEREGADIQKELQELEIRKAEATIGRAYHCLMIGLAILGSTTLTSSIPVILLELLPRWADITMVAGGALTGPSAVHETGTTKMWLEQARDRVKIQETKIAEYRNTQS